MKKRTLDSGKVWCWPRVEEQCDVHVGIEGEDRTAGIDTAAISIGTRASTASEPPSSSSPSSGRSPRCGRSPRSSHGWVPRWVPSTSMARAASSPSSSPAASWSWSWISLAPLAGAAPHTRSRNARAAPFLSKVFFREIHPAGRSLPGSPGAGHDLGMSVPRGGEISLAGGDCNGTTGHGGRCGHTRTFEHSL